MRGAPRKLRRRMKVRTTLSPVAWIPNREAFRTVCITSAQWMSIFEGIQPRLRQLLLKGPSSTTATGQPASDASDETSSPEPIAMRSNLIPS